MKKTILFLIVFAAIAAAISAQTYTVQEVRGRVEREAGGQRAAVAVGDTLNADTVIHTGVGAALVLMSNESSFTIPAVRSGRVSELASSSSGVRIGGNISRVNTDGVTRTTGQVSTASARASDSAEDLDLAAE